MLAERFLPTYDFSQSHSIRIAGSPSDIYGLVEDMDFSKSWIIRVLFTLRGLGSRTSVGKDLLSKRFIPLESSAPHGLAYGLVGQFWKLDGNLQKIDPREFLRFQQPGFLKAVWSFDLQPLNESISVLSTETRVQCLDQSAKSRFAPYWFIVRPFSGIIRKEILRAIKRKAEEGRTSNS